MPPDEVAEDVPLRNTPERRVIPCKRGHDLSLSYRADNRWQCRACRRGYVKEWAAENPDKRKASQVRQNAKRRARRLAAASTPAEKALRRLAAGSATDSVTGCREWSGRLERGYGRIGHQRRTHYAHRLAWTILRGAIPDGMVIDHICHNRKCIQPAHLRVTTPEGNGANKSQAPAGRLAALWERLTGIEGTHLVRG